MCRVRKKGMALGEGMASHAPTVLTFPNVMPFRYAAPLSLASPFLFQTLP